jgi:hypothetical protein
MVRQLTDAYLRSYDDPRADFELIHAFQPKFHSVYFPRWALARIFFCDILSVRSTKLREVTHKLCLYFSLAICEDFDPTDGVDLFGAMERLPPHFSRLEELQLSCSLAYLVASGIGDSIRLSSSLLQGYHPSLVSLTLNCVETSERKSPTGTSRSFLSAMVRA